MKSRTSFFNRGLSLSLLRRSWPLWTSYFVLLLLMVPGSLMSISQRSDLRMAENSIYLYRNLNRSMLDSGVNVAILSFFVCVLVAMAMFGFMYNNRSTSMYCSLPIKRETVFATAFFTGLIPMLIADLLIALICLGFCGEGMLEAKNVWLFLSMAVMGNIAFYGMAAFCSVLTGHILVLPAVYVVLNIAAALAEIGIYTARDTLVYGFSGKFNFQFLSPIVNLANTLHVQSQWVRDIEGGMVETGEYLLKGYGWLAAYCAAGLVLAVLAMFLYRRRKMESSGDVVAIGILKPIFRYCMCFGVALMFAYVVHGALFGSYLTGLAEACCYLLLMLCGAFIGYFAAEMLMQKTLRVFRGKWKGFVLSCLIICAFVGINEFDLFGYEKRQPKLEDVDHVWLSYYNGSEFHEEENIRHMYDFHRQLIDEKEINENCDNMQAISFTYFLKDGNTFTRNYYVSSDYEQQRDESSGINTLAKVVNLQEAIDSRVATKVPVTVNNMVHASLEGSKFTENGEMDYFSLQLSPAQAYEFYTQCIVPDAAEGKLCRLFPINTEEYYSMATTVTFHFSIFNTDVNTMDDWYNSYYDFTMYLDAERCCRWIEENTDIPLISMGELDPEGMERTLYELRNGLELSTKAVG